MRKFEEKKQNYLQNVHEALDTKPKEKIDTAKGRQGGSVLRRRCAGDLRQVRAGMLRAGALGGPGPGGNRRYGA